MAGRYKPYPKYKDSGIEWLGEIPAHWPISPLKYLCSFSGGGTPSKDRPEYWSGDIPWVSPKDMKSSRITSTIDNVTELAVKQSSTSLVGSGALLMVVRSGILQHSIPVAINDVPVTLNQDMKALRLSSRLNVKYLMYFISGNQAQLLLEWSKQGATVESIEQEYLANTIFPAAPIHEQNKIAAFLDHEIAKIDTLIEKQKQLIQLLKEKRQAVISHAVTKGLSSLNGGPSAKMRDSGVEWLGEVPEHWGVASIRRYLLEHRQGYYTTDAYVDEGAKLLRITDLRELGEISITDCPKVTFSEALKNYFLQEGDVVFARTGGAGSFGVIPLMHEVIAYASYLIRFRFLPEHFNTNYLRFMFVADSFQLAVKRNIHGGVTQNIHAEDIKDALVATPPLSEQLEIASYLDMQSSKYAVMISKASSAIELMQERRTALISAAVTGRIDVRDWVASPASPTHKEVAA